MPFLSGASLSYEESGSAREPCNGMYMFRSFFFSFFLFVCDMVVYITKVVCDVEALFWKFKGNVV